MTISPSIGASSSMMSWPYSPRMRILPSAPSSPIRWDGLPRCSFAGGQSERSARWPSLVWMTSMPEALAAASTSASGGTTFCSRETSLPRVSPKPPGSRKSRCMSITTRAVAATFNGNGPGAASTAPVRSADSAVVEDESDTGQLLNFAGGWALTELHRGQRGGGGCRRQVVSPTAERGDVDRCGCRRGQHRCVCNETDFGTAVGQGDSAQAHRPRGAGQDRRKRSGGHRPRLHFDCGTCGVGGDEDRD